MEVVKRRERIIVTKVKLDPQIGAEDSKAIKETEIRNVLKIQVYIQKKKCPTFFGWLFQLLWSFVACTVPEWPTQGVSPHDVYYEDNT